MANCRCLSREEALGFMQVMLEYGYLICCDASERMRDDDSLVTVQAPNMWACALWQPSEGGMFIQMAYQKITRRIC